MNWTLWNCDGWGLYWSDSIAFVRDDASHPRVKAGQHAVVVQEGLWLRGRMMSRRMLPSPVRHENDFDLGGIESEPLKSGQQLRLELSGAISASYQR